MQLLSFNPQTAKEMGLDEAILFSWLEQISSCSLTSRLLLSMDKISSKFCWWDQQDIIDTLDSLQRQEHLHFSISNNQLSVDFHAPIEAAPTISIPVIESSKKYETTPIKSMPVQNSVNTNTAHSISSINSVQAQNKGDFASWESFSEPQVVKSKTQIFQGWQPGNDFFTTCRNMGIEKVFALSQLPEFVLYHQNKATMSDTWESLFMGWVKRNWASSKAAQNTQNGSNNVQTNAQNANTTFSQTANSKQQIRARISDINDTDW